MNTWSIKSPKSARLIFGHFQKFGTRYNEILKKIFFHIFHNCRHTPSVFHYKNVFYLHFSRFLSYFIGFLNSFKISKSLGESVSMKSVESHRSFPFSGGKIAKSIGKSVAVKSIGIGHHALPFSRGKIAKTRRKCVAVKPIGTHVHLFVDNVGHTFGYFGSCRDPKNAKKSPL